MDNHFNTPAEVIDLSIKACENKTRLPLGKMILLGIMAGAFIAFGGATSSTAAHAVENVGVARALAGCIFPVGLMPHRISRRRTFHWKLPDHHGCI